MGAFEEQGAKINQPATEKSADAQVLFTGQGVLPSNLDYAAVMQRPLIIPCEKDSPWFDVIRPDDKAAAISSLLDLASLAPAETCIRWAGGCKGFDQAMVDKLFTLVAKGSVSLDGERYFQGIVGSGGTVEYKDGVEAPVVCQVPFYLARLMPCTAWGSTPATYRARLSEGGVIASKYGAELDSRGHQNILTQDSATSFQGWDGDVRLYMEALEVFAKHDYKVAIAVVNGGDVTMDEALLALSKNIPIILVQGSGRACDQIIAAIAAGPTAVEELYQQAFGRTLLLADKDSVPSYEAVQSLAKVVDFDNPRTLSLVMDDLGLLSPIEKAPQALAS
jgi:hypothetical protein